MKVDRTKKYFSQDSKIFEEREVHTLLEQQLVDLYKTVPTFTFIFNLETEEILASKGAALYLDIANLATLEQYYKQIKQPYNFHIQQFWFNLKNKFKQKKLPSKVSIHYKYRLNSSQQDTRLLVEQTTILLDTEKNLWFCFCYLSQHLQLKQILPFNPVFLFGQCHLHNWERDLKALVNEAYMMTLPRGQFFSSKEMEIIKQIGSENLSCREVAELQKRSTETIRTHLKHILAKGRKLFDEQFESANEVAAYMNMMGY